MVTVLADGLHMLNVGEANNSYWAPHFWQWISRLIDRREISRNLMNALYNFGYMGSDTLDKPMSEH